MRTTFKLDGNRKELVKAISEITGEKSKYMRMPTCAYQIGEITVEKDGTVVGDIASIIGELKNRGFEPEQEDKFVILAACHFTDAYKDAVN